MAGDSQLPRLLTRAIRAAVLTGGLAAAACSGDTSPEDPRGARAPATTAGAQPAGTSDDASLPDHDPDAEGALGHASWWRGRAFDLETLQRHLPEQFTAPIHPGSLFKVIAARAALEQAVPAVHGRIACPRRVEVLGRRADCVHPDLGRPLTMEDAIAHSCNHFFAQLASRLDRRALESTARRLLGQPFDSGDLPLPLVVLGLEGPKLGLDAWTRGVIAAVNGAGDAPRGLDAVVRGLVRATRDGTASALDEPHALTLAKTGTTLTGDRGEGLVVAWRPESDEVVAVRAPGVAGRDAARLARAIWERAAREQEPYVRVGRTRGPGASPSTTVESMPLEDYVAGVVAGEGEPSLPQAVHEALAVAARSYASAPDGRHAADGYDVCDTTHCQRLVAATAWSRAAAAATRGLVLAVGTTPVAVPYSAACSGTLVAPSDVWGGAPSSLTRVGPDPGTHEIPTWSSEATAEDLTRALRLAGHRGDVLRNLRIVARSRAGHPTRLALDGLSSPEIDATAFRHIVGRVLGWDVLKSHVWDVTRTGRGYRFDGRGKGHGAGLCVRGAAVLAARGVDAAQLLQAYVPGAHRVALQDRVTLRLPHARLGEAAPLASMARRQLVDLRRRLGVTGPRRIEVRVHPTVESYQRATGRAWWTAASTTPQGAAAYRVDLAPAGADATIRSLHHELVHVLTMRTLQLAPDWAAEGLAVLAGQHAETASLGAESPTCPSGAAIDRPGREAIRENYLAASRCVAAALPQGLDTWRRLVGLTDAPSGTASPVYEQ